MGGRFAAPVGRLRRVLRNALPGAVQDGKQPQRIGIALLGRSRDPMAGLRLVLFDPVPVEMQRCQDEHALGGAALRRFARPFNGFVQIRRDISAGPIHAAQADHRRSISARPRT